MAEQVFPATPISTAAGRVITSPFQFVLDGTDNLRIVACNSAPGVRITIQGRRLDEAGKLDVFTYDHVPTAIRAVSRQDYSMGKGAILNLTVFASAGAPLVGHTYVMVQLIRGLAGATIVLGTLLAGYITSTQALGWPGSPIVASTDGEPLIRAVNGTLPAVNTDWSESVPTGARWEILSILARLAAAIAGVPRTTVLQTYAPGVFVARYPPAATQADTTVRDYVWAPNIPFSPGVVSSTIQQPIQQRLILPAGSVFESIVFGMGGGDQWVALSYTVREWLEVT